MKPATMLESVRIRGFRSLADVELSGLAPATVLIGANGSGKSNILRFFDMLHAILARPGRLNRYVQGEGGANYQLFGGCDVTPSLEAEITLRSEIGWSGYRFRLAYAHPNSFYFEDESLGSEYPLWQTLGSGHRESKIVDSARSPGNSGDGFNACKSIVDLFLHHCVYQFHNPSGGSKFKRGWDADDNDRLLPDGGNLAAVLYRLEREDGRRYDAICRLTKRLLPGFDHFAIEESDGKVALSWQPQWANKTIGAHLTSDGSLRLFALITLLNLPPEMLPGIILLDEPELGLHPSAVDLLGGMIRSLSVQKQIIVATQSPQLVDEFNLEEIFVFDIKDGRTHCRKLNPREYEHWLEDYSTGQLWEKNVFGGRP